MDAIDARTQRLLEERSAALGGDAQAPRSAQLPTGEEDRQRSLRQHPDTTNPAASELEFDPADEARDLEARLLGFSREAAGIDGDQEILEIDLAQALQIAQTSSREYRDAEEEYILGAIRLLIERHRWSPRFFATTSASLAGQGDDGRFEHALNVIQDLRVTKQLPYGGDIEARWVWRATEQLRQQVSGRYRQSSEIALSADIPLLRGAGMVAQESLIQSERDLVYDARDFERLRRQFFFSIARDYYRLLQAKATIANEKQRIEGLTVQLERTRALADMGRRPPFEIAISEGRLLSAISSLKGSQENYTVQLEQFKIRLGLPSEQPIRVSNKVFDLVEPDISMQAAMEAGLAYRLDLQNRRDQLDDRRRAVRNARNNILPDLDVFADVAVPTDPDDRVGNFAYETDDFEYSTGVTFGLPLDREIERLQLRQAMISLRSAERGFEEYRDNLALEIRSAVRTIDLRRRQLDLAEQQLAITLRRKQEQDLKFQDGLVTTQEVIDTENELIEARNSRDRAQIDLRIAVLDYLFQTGQLRFDASGAFEPLEGLQVTPVEIFANVPFFDEWYLDARPWEEINAERQNRQPEEQGREPEAQDNVEPPDGQ